MTWCMSNGDIMLRDFIFFCETLFFSGDAQLDRIELANYSEQLGVISRADVVSFLVFVITNRRKVSLPERPGLHSELLMSL